MARPKVVRKSGSHSARKSVQTSKFPADRLPTELIHMVFAYIEPKEAATFRWAGRIVAEVGLQYLTSKVCLRLREDSYDSLLTIAKHPVASKFVVEVQYETEGLWFISRKTFDQIFFCTNLRSQRHNSSAQEASCNMPLPSKKRTARQTKELLNRVWSMYEEYQAGHKKVEQADFFRTKMVEAFKRLPALKILSTPAKSSYERYLAQIKELLPTYSFADLEAYGEPSCVGATKSVLLAAESAGLQLSNFQWPRFNWPTLKRDLSGLPIPSRSIFHLKVLNLAFMWPPYRGQNGEYHGLGLTKLVDGKNGCVFSLLSSAPNLECVELNFNAWPSYYWGPNLNRIFEHFHWPSLKAISLDRVRSNAQYLVVFLESHKRTLREISLRDMRALPGSWNMVFHRMRRIFNFGHQLDACTLRGTFRDTALAYEMETIGEGYIVTTGTMISDYVRATNFGDITLTEYWEIMKPR